MELSRQGSHRSQARQSLRISSPRHPQCCSPVLSGRMAVGRTSGLPGFISDSRYPGPYLPVTPCMVALVAMTSRWCVCVINSAAATLPRTTTRRFATPFRPPLDIQRAARAFFFHVEPLGDDRYRVCGQADDYYVTLSPYFSCDCGDAIIRAVICKHQIAALYFAGDEEAVRLFGELRKAWRAHRRKKAEESADSTAQTERASRPQPGQAKAEDVSPGAIPDKEPGRPERVVLNPWWT